MKKFLVAIPMGIAIALSLTACDPPLPPEVRTAILEQNVTCESGEVSIYAPLGFTGIADYLSENLTANCPDLLISTVEAADDADLVIGSVPSADGGMSYTPLVYDAVVVGTNLVDLGSLTLSADSIAKIFDGTITTWNDPQLVADNPFEQMPEMPITLVTRAKPEVISAFEQEMSFLLGAPYTSGFEADPEFDYNEITYGDDGSIGLLSFVDNFDAYMLTAGFATDDQGGSVIADMLSMASAATQMETASSGNNLLVTLNRDAQVQPLPGSDQALAPYQMLLPIYLGYKPGNLPSQVAGLYLLRSDVQGDLEQFSLTMLNEQVRLESVAKISDGIPQPELTEEQLKLLGLD